MYLIYQDLVVKRLDVFAVPWLPAPYKALAKKTGVDMSFVASSSAATYTGLTLLLLACLFAFSYGKGSVVIFLELFLVL